MYQNRKLNCSKCNRAMGDELEWLVGRDTRATHRFKNSYQQNTCYSCLKTFCAECLDDDDESDFPEFLKLCGTCDRDYCADCSLTLACSTPGCGDGGNGLMHPQRVIPVRKKCARNFAFTLVMVVVGLPAGVVCSTMNAVGTAEKHIVMTASMAKNTTFITVKIAMSQLVSIANLLVRKLGVGSTART